MNQPESDGELVDKSVERDLFSFPGVKEQNRNFPTGQPPRQSSSHRDPRLLPGLRQGCSPIVGGPLWPSRFNATLAK